MEQKSKNHKRCRASVIRKLERISYLIYEIACIDCEEAKVSLIEADLATLKHYSDIIRRKYIYEFNHQPTDDICTGRA
jgi:hypothetical protein